eukprot:30920-Pelagococcus_subviridis.AAC.23
MNRRAERPQLHLLRVLRDVPRVALFPRLRHGRIRVGVHEQVERARLLQERQERHRRRDLAYDGADLLVDLLLRLLRARRGARRARRVRVRLDVKHPALEHLLRSDRGDDQHELLQLLLHEPVVYLLEDVDQVRLQRLVRAHEHREPVLVLPLERLRGVDAALEQDRVHGVPEKLGHDLGAALERDRVLRRLLRRRHDGRCGGRDTRGRGASRTRTPRGRV